MTAETLQPSKAFRTLSAYESATERLELARAEVRRLARVKDEAEKAAIRLLKQTPSVTMVHQGQEYRIAATGGIMARPAAPDSWNCTLDPDANADDGDGEGPAPLMTDPSRAMGEYLSDRDGMVDAKNVDDDGTLVLPSEDKGWGGYARLAAVDEPAAVAARNAYGFPAMANLGTGWPAV